MASKPVLSIVSPVFQSAENVPELIRRITEAVLPLSVPFEIILAEDGSSDTTWQVIAEQFTRTPPLVAIKLQRNYGQHTAIRAGLEKSHGDFVIVMDCDLQDPPESIPLLYQKIITEQVDAVFAMRYKNYNSVVQRWLSSGFYFILQLCTGVRLSRHVANFGIYRRTVIDAILQNRDQPLFFPLAARRAAARTSTLQVVHAKRFAGRSAYTIFKAMRLAAEILYNNTFLAYIYRIRQAPYTVHTELRHTE